MGSRSISSAGRCLQHHNIGSTAGVQFTEEFVQQSSGNLCLIPPLRTSSKSKNDLVSDLTENTVQQRFHVSVSLSIP